MAFAFIIIPVISFILFYILHTIILSQSTRLIVGDGTIRSCSTVAELNNS